VELKPGENKINIELFKERTSKLKVRVFDFETMMSPIENVQLKVNFLVTLKVLPIHKRRSS
jgi:hypothetical protein